MNKFSDIEKNSDFNNLLSLASQYESQLKDYQFLNEQFYELSRLEEKIKKCIEPFLDNDDLLLSGIKVHWSIIKFVNKGEDFIIKACKVNPKCARSVQDLQTLVKLYNIDPKITENAVPYYKDKLKEYLKNNPQKATQLFYSLDGQSFGSMEEAVARNVEIQNNLTSGPSL